MAKDNYKRDPSQIRAEIEQTRARMGHTVDALETKLNPQRLRQEAMSNLREQTVGKVETLAGDAGDTVKGASADVFETIKQNPLPAALAAIGIGWLFMESRNQSRYTALNPRPTEYGYSTQYRYYPSGTRRGGEMQGDMGNRMGQMTGQVQDKAQQMTGQVQDKAQQVAGQVQDKTQQVAGQVQDKAQQVTDQVQDKTQQVASQVQDQVSEWADTAQQGAYQVRSRFEDMMDQNPLLIGAAALALGAAIGLSLPATSKEDELFGDTRDTLMDKAQSTAQDTMQKAQQVVQRAGEAAKDAAKDEAQKQNLTTG